MSKTNRICRVCGKEYEACRTLKEYDGTFRWQEVACSPDCGEIYLKKVLASRRRNASKAVKIFDDQKDTKEVKETKPVEEVAEQPVVVSEPTFLKEEVSE